MSRELHEKLEREIREIDAIERRLKSCPVDSVNGNWPELAVRPGDAPEGRRFPIWCLLLVAATVSVPLWPSIQRWVRPTGFHHSAPIGSETARNVDCESVAAAFRAVLVERGLELRLEADRSATYVQERDGIEVAIGVGYHPSTTVSASLQAYGKLAWYENEERRMDDINQLIASLQADWRACVQDASMKQQRR